MQETNVVSLSRGVTQVMSSRIFIFETSPPLVNSCHIEKYLHAIIRSQLSRVFCVLRLGSPYIHTFFFFLLFFLLTLFGVSFTEREFQEVTLLIGHAHLGLTVAGSEKYAGLWAVFGRRGVVRAPLREARLLVVPVGEF